jgi:hypothetical protein
MQVSAQVLNSRRDSRRKLLLLWLCALAAIFIAAFVVGIVGIGGRPWQGWFEWTGSQTAQPFVLEVLPETGGAGYRAGIRRGDLVDLREQPLETRLWLSAEPSTTQPFSLLIHRGSRAMTVRVVGTTLWEHSFSIKVAQIVPVIVAAIWFVGCAFLIALRSARLPEGRALAVILLCEAVELIQFSVPNAFATAILNTITQSLLSVVSSFLMVMLASRFGAQSLWRKLVVTVAYALIAFSALVTVAGYYGLLTLRLDPAAYGVITMGVPAFISTLGIVTDLSILAAVLAAVLSAGRQQRARAAWLLLPLPLAWAAGGGIAALEGLSNTWLAYMSFNVLGYFLTLLAALAVTYALLKRHVLDFGFVLSRTVVVGIVSLIVVAAFVLLEWVLGPAVAGASHATGIIASALLALALGLSLRYIHRRVDAFVDAVLFRKRHEDERALIDFSHEAALVTERDALLDQAIGKIERHTNASNANLLLNSSGRYAPARAYGDAMQTNNVDENDGLILALRAWHKPLDPHHYQTALHGVIALPMFSRGRLLGVLLLGERLSGEAYAPDEVDALSQFAHGVGSALDALSLNDRDSVARLQESMSVFIDAVAQLHDTMRNLPDAIATCLLAGSEAPKS